MISILLIINISQEQDKRGNLQAILDTITDRSSHNIICYTRSFSFHMATQKDGGGWLF